MPSELIYTFGFVGMLGIIAYFDLRYHKIDDYYSIGAWMFLLGAGLNNSSYFTYAIFCFCFLWLLNRIAFGLNKKPAFGWADVLVLPTIFAFIIGLPNGGAFFLIGFVLANIQIALTKKPQPLMLYMFIAYLTAVMLSVVTR